jgi:hypothetical protein
MAGKDKVCRDGGLDEGEGVEMNDQTPVAVQQTTVIQVGSQKSVAGAVLLALFFGPLGMIYSTVVGALIMFAISFIVAIATLGLGLIITAPICAIWAGIAASNHNKRLGISSQHAALTGATAPAGWHLDPSGSGRLRFYDGRQWTDHFADRDSQPAAVGPEELTVAQLESSSPAEPSAAEEPAPESAIAAESVEPETEDEVDGSEAPTSVAEIDPEPDAPSEQVFCGSCGAGISPTARFCSTCGEAQAVA